MFIYAYESTCAKKRSELPTVAWRDRARVGKASSQRPLWHETASRLSLKKANREAVSCHNGLWLLANAFCGKTVLLSSGLPYLTIPPALLEVCQLWWGSQPYVDHPDPFFLLFPWSLDFPSHHRRDNTWQSRSIGLIRQMAEEYLEKNKTLIQGVGLLQVFFGHLSNQTYRFFLWSRRDETGQINELKFLSESVSQKTNQGCAWQQQISSTLMLCWKLTNSGCVN